MEQAVNGLSAEPLGKYKIYITADHSFGTDAVLLADFAARKKTADACDLGTGCGIIPLLLLKDGAAETVCGVEIQPAAAELSRENARLNGIEDKFTVINRDLKELSDVLKSGSFDLVTCNPPYKAPDGGSKNESEAQRIARHEIKCVFSDVAEAAAKLLRFGGRFCVCHRPERMADVIAAMREKKLEPKIFREVIQRNGEEPWLILVEARLGGKPGMRIMPPLYVEENGVLSDEMMKIYGDYKDGKGRGV